MIGLEFGKKVLYKFKSGSKMEKINPGWVFGIFGEGNEIMISRPE